MALDYNGKEFATSRHSPVAALQILLQEVERHCEALSNIVWATSKVLERNFFRQTGCGLVKGECSFVRCRRKLRILQSNWDQYSNRKTPFR
jgi:hypothetical protein